MEAPEVLTAVDEGCLNNLTLLRVELRTSQAVLQYVREGTHKPNQTAQCTDSPGLNPLLKVLDELLNPSAPSQIGRVGAIPSDYTEVVLYKLFVPRSRPIIRSM